MAGACGVTSDMDTGRASAAAFPPVTNSVVNVLFALLEWTGRHPIEEIQARPALRNLLLSGPLLCRLHDPELQRQLLGAADYCAQMLEEYDVWSGGFVRFPEAALLRSQLELATAFLDATAPAAAAALATGSTYIGEQRMYAQRAAHRSEQQSDASSQTSSIALDLANIPAYISQHRESASSDGDQTQEEGTDHNLLHSLRQKLSAIDLQVAACAQEAMDVDVPRVPVGLPLHVSLFPRKWHHKAEHKARKPSCDGSDAGALHASGCTCARASWSDSMETDKQSYRLPPAAAAAGGGSIGAADHGDGSKVQAAETAGCYSRAGDESSGSDTGAPAEGIKSTVTTIPGIAIASLEVSG